MIKKKKKRRSKVLKSGALSEETIHSMIMEWVEINPLIKSYRHLIMHFPNEGKRTYGFGVLLKSMGMRKGVSDFFIAVPRRGFGGAWIELKSADGVLSTEQKKFLKDMGEQNFYTHTCWSFEEAIYIIQWYLV